MKRVFLILSLIIAISIQSTALAHPGRTDSNGGHNVNAEGWGYEVGTYHFHDKYENIVPVDKNTLKPTALNVVVNGEMVKFDQSPEMINEKVMVPIRYVAEKMGCLVEWDEATRTVYIDESGPHAQRHAIKTENINVYVNGERVVFTDQQPIILNGRTLIPLRSVAEKLGYLVEWDGALQIVYVLK